jgi:hypothetical protein
MSDQTAAVVHNAEHTSVAALQHVSSCHRESSDIVQWHQLCAVLKCGTTEDSLVIVQCMQALCVRALTAHIAELSTTFEH